jgi:hypothetical protein
MRQIFYIAAFWVVVIVTIRLAVCFPRSLLARVLFMRHGPERERGEDASAYFLRCARFHAGWCAQAALVFAVGGVAVAWDPLLQHSVYFLALWAVVVPVLGACELLAAMVSLARAWWLRRLKGKQLVAG